MKKALLTLLGVVGVAVVGLLVVASGQPDTYRVERSLTVAATPADVFPYLNDYTRWAEWNPWGKLDPNQKVENSDPASGVGAWTTWEGNSDVGKGRMSILESVPDQKVVHQLEFIEPFEDKGLTTFTVSAEGEGATVGWAMDGDMNLMSKVMCLFKDMDSMIGPDFDRGLASLKEKAEASALARVEAEKAAAAAAEAAAQAAAEAAAQDGATAEN